MGRHLIGRTARMIVLGAVVVLAGCGSGSSDGASDGSSDPRDEITFSVTGTATASAAALEQTATILQRRLRALGAEDAKVEVRAETLVATGTDPAVAGRAAISGLLELRPVLAVITPMSTDTNGGEVLPNNPANDVNVEYSVGPAALTGESVVGATAESLLDDRWVVTLELDEQAAITFNQLAAALYPKAPPENSVAIVLDGVVQSAPSFQTNSFSGPVQISGTFTEAEAKALAAVLESGELPVQIKLDA